MHTVEAVEQAVELARRLGYSVRHEWLDGSGGGACELHGRKLLVLDLAQSPAEQLAIIGQAISELTAESAAAIPGELRRALRLPRAA
jgi:hypothetical protein